MDTNDFLRITAEFTVPNSSNPAVMVWDYRVISATAPFDLTGSGEEITDAFIARHYVPMQNYVSNTVVLNHVSIRAFADVADGYDEFGVLWTGGGSGNMLPPFVTTSIQLTRSNYAMRNGRKAYPGVMTSTLVGGGIMNPVAVADIAAITAVWLSEGMAVEGEGSDIVLQNYIVRVPATEGVNPTVFSTIASYGAAKYGTQNSRKA